MLKHLFILAGAAAVFGCATPASEPKDGERARLRGVGGSFSVDQNVCGDRPDLSNGVFVDLGSPYWKKSIGMPRGTISTPVWGEMYIRADQQVKVTANYLSGSSICTVVSYFKPEKDRDYEFIISRSGLTQCRLGFADITSGDARSVEASEEKLPCN